MEIKKELVMEFLEKNTNRLTTAKTSKRLKDVELVIVNPVGKAKLNYWKELIK